MHSSNVEAALLRSDWLASRGVNKSQPDETSGEQTVKSRCRQRTPNRMQLVGTSKTAMTLVSLAGLSLLIINSSIVGAHQTLMAQLDPSSSNIHPQVSIENLNNQQHVASSQEHSLSMLSSASGNQALQNLQSPISVHNQQQPMSFISAESPSFTQSLASSPRVIKSRSLRSIGEVFKRLSSGHKRSKQSSQSTRDLEQQQQQQQQQQQSQVAAANNFAALAAAAANQRAVYASPFQASYNPHSSPYAQFSPYTGASLFAWPAATGHPLASTLQAHPALIAAPASHNAVALTPTGLATPLYAAASQSYNSYAAPPSPPQANSQSQPTSNAANSVGIASPASGPSQANPNAGNPMTAASHVHANAVPAPTSIHSSNPSPSIDFHQVLDALVRSSGFAPAGDQEAVAATGYGNKYESTPVFSFKKLISLPFYLSTEEKQLDGLANAHGPSGHSAGGYSLHSMPLMRRHVRRMSIPSLSSSTGSSQQQSMKYTDPTELTQQQQQQQYSNYFNALNNQLASNGQLLHYLTAAGAASQQASEDLAPQTSQALANYQALASIGSAHQRSQILSPFHSRGSLSGYMAKASQSGNSVGASSNKDRLSFGASMISPVIGVPSPYSVEPSQHSSQRLQSFASESEAINSLMNSIQPPSAGHSQPQLYYWPRQSELANNQLIGQGMGSTGDTIVLSHLPNPNQAHHRQPAHMSSPSLINGNQLVDNAQNESSLQELNGANGSTNGHSSSNGSASANGESVSSVSSSSSASSSAHGQQHSSPQQQSNISSSQQQAGSNNLSPANSMSSYASSIENQQKR